MKRKMFFALFAAGMLCAAEPGEEYSFRKNFLNDSSAILEVLEKHNPGFLSSLTADDVDKAVGAWLERSGSGVVRGTLPEPSQKAKNTVYPIRLISSDRILYSRLDSMNKESAAAFRKDCEAIRRLPKNPVGIIVDLRSCKGGDDESALSILASLMPSEKLPGGTYPKNILNLPVAALISGNTSGPAEIFTVLLEKTHHGISIGQKTAGIPFERKEFKFGKDTWLIPMPRKELSFIRPAPVPPTLAADSKIQTDYAIFRKPGEKKYDPTITRSAELLITLGIIHKRGLSK